jgi:hypothetical protein
MRPAEHAAEVTNFVEGFRPLIWNPDVRVGGVFHGFILHQTCATKKPNRFKALILVRFS